jgi:hypothetical protein
MGHFGLMYDLFLFMKRSLLFQFFLILSDQATSLDSKGQTMSAPGCTCGSSTPAFPVVLVALGGLGGVPKTHPLEVVRLPYTCASTCCVLSQHMYVSKKLCDAMGPPSVGADMLCLELTLSMLVRLQTLHASTCCALPPPLCTYIYIYIYICILQPQQKQLC